MTETAGFISGDARKESGFLDPQASELPTLPCGLTQDFGSSMDGRIWLLPVLNPGATTPKHRPSIVFQHQPYP